MVNQIPPKKMIQSTARRSMMRRSHTSKRWSKNLLSKETSSISREILIKDQRMFKVPIHSMKDSRLFVDSRVANFLVDKSSVLLLQEHSSDSPRYFFWMRPPLPSMKTVRRKSKMLSIKLERVAP